ncbi:hypothetical protein DLEV_117 [Diachasmimorpha longicaudata entomopoxvirus]|uniref:Uncharacterized protein n=1 Tax=Diachasmimorpha longicaudata entomopoxvirus TaxID=109981 RepID=A0A7R5WS27_9POXV|nr:hypothetical protein QKK69_gp117 [Diachasmimorpha longicaudata entomopoxvirus]AKS26408.1 hypothetical protein DLEV_117 [Diachasmimorpha longicaudata entomopoxvirus]
MSFPRIPKKICQIDNFTEYLNQSDPMDISDEKQNKLISEHNSDICYKFFSTPTGCLVANYEYTVHIFAISTKSIDILCKTKNGSLFVTETNKEMANIFKEYVKKDCVLNKLVLRDCVLYFKIGPTNCLEPLYRFQIAKILSQKYIFEYIESLDPRSTLEPFYKKTLYDEHLADIIDTVIDINKLDPNKKYRVIKVEICLIKNKKKYLIKFENINQIYLSNIYFENEFDTYEPGSTFLMETGELEYDKNTNEATLIIDFLMD